MNRKLNGLILAGGRSSRMGYDKSLIEYHAVSQREYLFEILTNFCDHVYTSCKKSESVPSHLNPLPDQFNLESPLNGILTAFSTHKDVAWLTVPIDMPNLDKTVLEYLIGERDQTKIATCFFDSDGEKPEPLLTLWEKHGYALMLDFYNAGNKSPREFLIQQDINVIEAPDKKYLININDPDDLKKFQANKN
jgi:molybdopterin-guanine dinucleotide biosynthesis protein A